jgi:hypothetical protein
MHHNVSLVFTRMAQALRTGGYLAIADLDPEEGSFHTDLDRPRLEGRSTMASQLGTSQTEGLIM